jgi:hypothetical protein
MVKQTARTPPGGACHKVGLPGFHCRRGYPLRLFARGFGFGDLAGGFGDAVGLLLARVYALVDHRLQSARFVASGGERPCSNVADGHADSLPVQLGLEDERLGASGHANGKTGRVGVPEEELPGSLG